MCFLIGADGAILWSDLSDSPVAMADARARWLAIWDRRDAIAEIAHSHPVGPLRFSREDETTFAALITALDRPLRFSVVSPAGYLVRDLDRDVQVENESKIDAEPWWVALLRAASGMRKER